MEVNVLVVMCLFLLYNVGDIWWMVYDYNVDVIVLLGFLGIFKVCSYIILYR